ncbi:MAG: 50S ribosomal protein L15 [Magnetovibrio sp.]|nr:50S ribosomal protein L15 [Magnetovibrio sp.]
MKLNDIQDNKGANISRKRVGRGIGSGTGKTSGRGHKGQKSRSGVSLLGFEGGQMPLYRRLPKRGFKNPFSKKYTEINLGTLQKAIDTGKIDAEKEITETTLIESGLLGKLKDGVRLLGKGELKSVIKLSVTTASNNAINYVEKVGGTVILPSQKAKPEGKGKRRDKLSAERKAARAATLKSE